MCVHGVVFLSSSFAHCVTGCACALLGLGRLDHRARTKRYPWPYVETPPCIRVFDIDHVFMYVYKKKLQYVFGVGSLLAPTRLG